MTFGPFASSWVILDEEVGIVGRNFALVIAIVAVACHDHKDHNFLLFLKNGKDIMI